MAANKIYASFFCPSSFTYSVNDAFPCLLREEMRKEMRLPLASHSCLKSSFSLASLCLSVSYHVLVSPCVIRTSVVSYPMRVLVFG